MTISQPVKEELGVAEKHLREALAISARTEKAHVPGIIAEIIVKLNTLIEVTDFMGELEDKIPKRF